MHKELFDTFLNASAYASNSARESRTSVKLERHGSSWAVYLFQSLKSPTIRRRDAADSAGLLEQIDQVSQHQIELAAYLDERRNHYESLTYETLIELWKCRDLHELIVEEEELLRETLRNLIEVRHRETINGPQASGGRRICGSCGGDGKVRGGCSACDGKGWS